MSVLLYILMGISVGMIVLFMAIIGFSFWTSFIWNEYMKMDDN